MLDKKHQRISFIAQYSVFVVALSFTLFTAASAYSQEGEDLFFTNNRAIAGDYSLSVRVLNPSLSDNGHPILDSVAVFEIKAPQGELLGEPATLAFYGNDDLLIKKRVEQLPCTLKYDFRGTRPGQYTLAFIVKGSHGRVGIGRLEVIIRHN